MRRGCALDLLCLAFGVQVLAACADGSADPRTQQAQNGPSSEDPPSGTAGTSGDAGAPSVGDAGTGGQPALPPDVVSGVILQRNRLVPAPDVILNIAGKTISTDAAGKFEVGGVPETYDVTVFTGERRVHVFKGLTRRDPTLRVSTIEPGTRFAGITGTLSGGAGFPTPANHVAAVGFLLTPGVWNTARADTGLYDLNTIWYFDPARQLEIRALQWSVAADGLPNGYAGWGAKTVDVVDATKLQDVGIQLEPIESRKLIQTFSIPAGYNPFGWVVRVGPIPVYSSAPKVTGSVEYAVPKQLNGAPLLVSVQSDQPLSQGTWRVSEETQTLASKLLPVPSQLVPFEEGSGITPATNFSWKPFEGGVHEISFISTDQAATVTLAETSTTMPDLSGYGIPFPRGARYRWHVRGVGPATSVDEVAGAQELLDLKNEFYEAETPDRAFKTAD